MHTNYTSFPVVALTDGGQDEGEFYLRAPSLVDAAEAYTNPEWDGQKLEVIFSYEHAISLAQLPGPDGEILTLTAPATEGEVHQSRFEAPPQQWLRENDPVSPARGHAPEGRVETTPSGDVAVISVAVARGALRELYLDALRNQVIARAESDQENEGLMEKAEKLRRALEALQ